MQILTGHSIVYNMVTFYAKINKNIQISCSFALLSFHPLHNAQCFLHLVDQIVQLFFAN